MMPGSSGRVWGEAVRGCVGFGDRIKHTAIAV